LARYGRDVTVRLRQAALADREELGRLLDAYLFEFDGRTEPYPHFDAYWQEPERRPFLIESDGEVVGVCLVRVHDDGWDIAEFTVVPERRRGGVGGAAVEALAELARAASATHLVATVHPDNRRALPFWLAAGFHEIAESGPIVTRRDL
jgi:ribosomal protein S18 acetylase RimI-like enzyme